MKIVLSGVETNNKGAELMFYAILQEIERKFPRAIVYTDVGSVRQGLNYIRTTMKLKNKPIAFLYKLFAKLRMFGIARRIGVPAIFDFASDVHAIKGASFFLDASGFHFSDQWHWSDDVVRRKRNLWKNQSREGTKMVFLPQAFGPFRELYSREHLKDMAQYADLIIPREKVSYQYLEDSKLVDMKKVKLYSDFTSLVHGYVPSQYKKLANAVCVIPNSRMFDKGGLTFDTYVDFLKRIIANINEKGYNVYLLNHEGTSDELLAYRCKSSLGQGIDVVTGLNGLEVKGLISTAKLVITSRFHGVASALNSCVPCLATSWSHKYAELYKDYGLDDSLLSLIDLDRDVKKVSEYLSDAKNMEIRTHLKSVLPVVQEQTRKMWEEIWDLGAK